MSAGIVHIVGDGLDAESCQRCLVCGEYVVDYRGAMMLQGEEPSAFPAGPVTIRRHGYITETTAGADDGVPLCGGPVQ